MLAHINLQAKTMGEHGAIIDKLDELVGLASLRTVAHDKFTGSQIENRRLASEPKTAYFCIAASFIAQRACHTAQAGALLLRHGFADQAFELWRTLFNLDALIQHLRDEDKEARAERYLSAAASEGKFLSSPLGTFSRAAIGSVESWDVLGHSTEGVPVQCLLTGYLLHRVVSTFCDATDEIPIYEDDQWFEQSESLLGEVSELFLARPDRREVCVVPNDSGLAVDMDDPKALKRLLEDEDVEHYLRLQG